MDFRKIVTGDPALCMKYFAQAKSMVADLVASRMPKKVYADNAMIIIAKNYGAGARSAIFLPQGYVLILCLADHWYTPTELRSDSVPRYFYGLKRDKKQWRKLSGPVVPETSLVPTAGSTARVGTGIAKVPASFASGFTYNPTTIEVSRFAATINSDSLAEAYVLSSQASNGYQATVSGSPDAISINYGWGTINGVSDVDVMSQLAYVSAFDSIYSYCLSVTATEGSVNRVLVPPTLYDDSWLPASGPSYWDNAMDQGYGRPDRFGKLSNGRVVNSESVTWDAAPRFFLYPESPNNQQPFVCEAIQTTYDRTNQFGFRKKIPALDIYEKRQDGEFEKVVSNILSPAVSPLSGSLETICRTIDFRCGDSQLMAAQTYFGAYHSVFGVGSLSAGFTTAAMNLSHTTPYRHYVPYMEHRVFEFLPHFSIHAVDRQTGVLDPQSVFWQWARPSLIPSPSSYYFHFLGFVSGNGTPRCGWGEFIVGQGPASAIVPTVGLQLYLAPETATQGIWDTDTTVTIPDLFSALGIAKPALYSTPVAYGVDLNDLCYGRSMLYFYKGRLIFAAAAKSHTAGGGSPVNLLSSLLPTGVFEIDPNTGAITAVYTGRTLADAQNTYYMATDVQTTADGAQIFLMETGVPFGNRRVTTVDLSDGSVEHSDALPAGFAHYDFMQPLYKRPAVGE